MNALDLPHVRPLLAARRTSPEARYSVRQPGKYMARPMPGFYAGFRVFLAPDRPGLPGINGRVDLHFS